MGDALRAMPNVTNVSVTANRLPNGDPSLIVTYDIHPAPWRRRHVRFDFWGSGPIVGAFDARPESYEIATALQTKCHIGPIGRV